MSPEELKRILGKEELLTVTREELEKKLDEVLKQIDDGNSPVHIIEDGKSDLLLFGWEDYKCRFSMIYPPEYFAEIEEACRTYKEEL